MSELSLSNQGNGAEKYYDDLVALSRVSAAISGLQDLDAILRILTYFLNLLLKLVGDNLNQWFSPNTAKIT